jgi:UDP-glucose 4-epimerase
MHQERALVTGAAGFIGSHVARHCRDLGMIVVGADNLSGGDAANVPGGVPLEVGDLTDPGFVDSLWARHGDFDYVYHLAAYAAEGLSHFVRRFNYQTNLVASVNLINASVRGRVRRFVFTSSIAVYGTGQVPLGESTVPHPEDPYGISKYAVELDLKAAEAMFGLPYTIFRPHNVYGEAQNIADRYRNVVGIFMNRLLQGQSMPVFGDGLQSRAFSHVDDVAPYIAASPRIPASVNGTYNIGSDTVTTVRDLAHHIAAAFGRSPVLEHLEARNEVVHAHAEHSRFRADFRPRDEVPLEVGLRRMADWVRSRGPAVPTVFKGIEIHDRLPASWR